MSLAGLPTNAEKNAQSAEELQAFLGLKLAHIRNVVSTLAQSIGRDRMFRAYTLHDISHLDAMLMSLDWIIPDETRAKMSPSDWLLIVLATYFHDLGLVVTNEEFENRERTSFQHFVNNVLYVGEKGEDYQAKVHLLRPEDREPFLYEEFVRYHHAERIKEWVMGRSPDRLGCAGAVAKEVDALLTSLPIHFRRDLGVVCESHHLDDLSDFRRYKVSYPYGNSPQETANVHYAALLLRTADLLHITKDRTPSVMFRLINPVDPLSQQEWAKQAAVSAVRPKLGLSVEGVPDPSAPKNTIEVFAYFTSPSGFFGLTVYLEYASQQLRKVADWNREAQQKHGSHFAFPWRHVDDQGIETEGFLPNAYGFSVDQPRILELLTGHTIYNDTSVVLRELVQNALDAVRLKALLNEEKRRPHEGHVQIAWDTGSRKLTVLDNGTGMTQTIIERNLLNVGSSRYQESEFRRQHPDFSPISRFGIGILSAFMIADEVEIVTLDEDASHGIHIALRSVHGKYLVRLLDRSDAELADIRGHGTRITLTLRSTAVLRDVTAVAQKWIVFPRCAVTLTIDSGSPQRIGFASAVEALTGTLVGAGYKCSTSQTPEPNTLRICSEQDGELDLAYAVRWSTFFQEWEFAVPPKREDENEELVGLGTCVEGIRVESAAPGYRAYPIWAIANFIGRGAPKTDVARARLEPTPELEPSLRRIYAAYMRHVAKELATLQRDFSLTWATQEGVFLLDALTKVSAMSSRAFRREVENLPLVIVEESRSRSAKAIAEVNSVDEWWTVESNLFSSAETLMREGRTSGTVVSVLESLGSAEDVPPIVISKPTGYVKERLFESREPVLIRCRPEQRRLDVCWGIAKRPSRWLGWSSRQLRRMLRPTERGYKRPVYIALDGVVFEGLDDALGVVSDSTFYLAPGTPLTVTMRSLYSRLGATKTPEAEAAIAVIHSGIVDLLVTLPLTGVAARRRFRRTTEEAPRLAARLSSIADISELEDAFDRTTWKVFNPFAWSRREPPFSEWGPHF